jgi:hypothetical protein
MRQGGSTISQNPTSRKLRRRFLRFAYLHLPGSSFGQQAAEPQLGHTTTQRRSVRRSYSTLRSLYSLSQYLRRCFIAVSSSPVNIDSRVSL